MCIYDGLVQGQYRRTPARAPKARVLLVVIMRNSDA